MTLVIRTDKLEAEVGLYKLNDMSEAKYFKWEAGRELSLTLNKKIDEILNLLSISLKDLEGVVIYKGPGSFTGLRIGFSVANALAYSLKIPIVSATGEDWIKKGLGQLRAGKNEKISHPTYGAPPITTKPRK